MFTLQCSFVALRLLKKPRLFAVLLLRCVIALLRINLLKLYLRVLHIYLKEHERNSVNNVQLWYLWQTQTPSMEILGAFGNREVDEWICSLWKQWKSVWDCFHTTDSYDFSFCILFECVFHFSSSAHNKRTCTLHPSWRRMIVTPSVTVCWKTRSVALVSTVNSDVQHTVPQWITFGVWNQIWVQVHGSDSRGVSLCFITV